MMIVFSGKSCSGKSTLVNYWCSLDKNSVCLSIDEIGHQVLEEADVKQALARQFCIPFNKVNRKNIAEIVFRSPKKMEILTQITWPKMEKVIDEFIEKNVSKNIVLDWALIPKTKYFEMADIKIFVECDFKTRLERAEKRDNITEAKFLEREKAAMEYTSYKFDYIIQNNDFKVAKEKVKELVYRELC